MTDFYTPPPFKACSKCGGSGTIWSKPDIEPCLYCDSTGRIPIYYTVEQWEKLTKRKVPNDMPIYVELEKNCWHIASKSILSKPITYRMVIITEAGSPPKDWRP